MTPAGLRVIATGPQVLVQDRGRPGLAHLGVPRSGALDAGAAALALRLLGEPADRAVLEVLLGGLDAVLEGGGARWCVVTGAPGPVRVAGRSVGHGTVVALRPGDRLEVGPAPSGARRVVAVSGGFDVPPVLGSRSTDVLSGLGPPPVVAGDLLPLGERAGVPVPVDVPAPGRASYDAHGALVLRVLPGPRADHVEPLAGGVVRPVLPDSDRVGLRLGGPPLARASGPPPGELASEGVARGAVQVPPDGRPVVFLADHPVTGGYPVVGVVHPDDLDACAQLRPGEGVMLRPVAGGER